MFRVLFLILAIFCTTILAQKEERPKAILIDDFGPVNDCQFGERMDSLFIALNNDPTSRGIIILYKGLDLLPAEYDIPHPMQNRIFNAITFRKIDKNRIEIIDGGFREKRSSELWLVPKDAVIPVPTKTVAKPHIPTDETFLYDNTLLFQPYEDSEPHEFLLPKVKADADEINKEINEWSKGSKSEEEIYKPTKKEIEESKFFWVNENFGTLIKQRKGTAGEIIFYADNTRLNIKKVEKYIEEGRARIAGKTGISTTKIKILFGGYRSWFEADFWIIPENGEPPKPTPEKRADPEAAGN